MAQMNYNRPNNGYEKEPWQKEQTKYTLPKLDPKPIREHKYQGHKIQLIKKKSGPHSGFYKCLDCNKWLSWAQK